MTQSKKPAVTTALLEYLTRLYPDRAPDISDSNREVWMKAGNVEVVKHLKHLHEEQKNSVLPG